jgi:hypothetical protein
MVFHVSSFVGIGDLEEDDRMDLDSDVEGHLICQSNQIWSKDEYFLILKSKNCYNFGFYLPTFSVKATHGIKVTKLIYVFFGIVLTLLFLGHQV